jgi:hypothetical protein
MIKSSETSVKTHYICQTYSEKLVGRAKQPALQIAKTIECSSAAAAEERARRTFEGGLCVGADAFFLTSDPDTGDVSAPTFLTRQGNVPTLEL